MKQKENGIHKHKIVSSISVPEIEKCASKPLAELALSSTLAYGPNKKNISQLLADFNKACNAGNPNLVIKIGVNLLESDSTRYIEAPKLEVVLAVARATSMVLDDNFMDSFWAFFYRFYYNYQSREDFLKAVLSR